ncbi:MAG TPA: hypothetical protein VEF04_17915 [Blastocatellia bacterium]|nr:hypothetical protein [Blastocatellia bacterium]
MPRKYEQDCVEECKKLYLRYNGQHHETIAKELSKRWAKFPADRVGAWAKKYGWDKLLLQRAEAELERVGWTNAQRAYNRVKKVVDRLEKKVESFDETDKEDVELLKLFHNYCSLEISALQRLDAERGSLEAFVAHWEWQMNIVAEISPRAAKELVAISEEILARAQDYFSGKGS